jgi:uncharacterized protein YdiU (UPF0061 family)
LAEKKIKIDEEEVLLPDTAVNLLSCIQKNKTDYKKSFFEIESLVEKAKQKDHRFRQQDTRNKYNYLCSFFHQRKLTPPVQAVRPQLRQAIKLIS